MRDYKKLLSGFLYGGKREENYLRKLIKSLVSPSMKLLLIKKLEDDYEEELISELRLRLIKSKDHWQSLEYISIQYLRTVIRNLLIDIVNGGKVEIYSLQEQVFKDETARPITYEDVLKDTRDPTVQVEGNTLFDALTKNLKDEDVPVLCYYFSKHFYHLEIKLSGISKDNLYKRWERLRKGKLREVFDGASPEELRIAVDMFLSEVCQRRGYIKSNEVEP